MTFWKLTLAYHGAGWHGWQVQPGLPTVQGALSEALRNLVGESVLPQGAGRTDAGVHALAQVCSFSLQSHLPGANLQRALNRILPASVRVLAAEAVSPEFHARHSARGKMYEYRIFERRREMSAGAEGVEERICSPFLAPLVWDCRWPLDLAALQSAARHIPGTRDFSAMAASTRPCRQDPGDDNAGQHSTPNPVKTVQSATWSREGNLLVFRIHGSGFLHHMVRNLVGTMVEAGRGRMSPEAMESILASRKRSAAGPTAPASGLYLAQVHYPEHPRLQEAAASERVAVWTASARELLQGTTLS